MASAVLVGLPHAHPANVYWLPQDIPVLLSRFFLYIARGNELEGLWLVGLSRLAFWSRITIVARRHTQAMVPVKPDGSVSS